MADAEDESTDPGGIVFHDGQWHMFLLAVPVWRQEANVQYATSDDGVTWTRHGMLFDQDDLDLSFAGLTIAVSSAIVLDDGTWALYFHTIDQTATLATGVIGRATAPAPEGPWTPDPEPVLRRGPEGAWDSKSVGHPSVIRVGGEYWMYYDGQHNDGAGGSERSIGMAVSVDGANWTKLDDPATTDALFAESDPLLTPSDGSWDASGVYDPNVVMTDEGFVMSYSSAATKSDQTCCSYRLGLAYSDDGVTWSKDPDSPYLQTDRLGFTWTGLSTLIHRRDRYTLLTNLETISGDVFDVRIWYLTHEGPIRPTT